MAEINCIINQTVLMSEPTKKIHLREPLAYNNANAHAMRVTVFNDDGNEMDLTGVGVTGSMKRCDNYTVEPINGTVSGNVAEVLLPASCYVVPGRFTFTMNLTGNGTTRTVLWVEGMVERNTTDSIVDPGTPVSNIDQAIGRANSAASAAETAAASATEAASDATAAASSAVRYDAQQDLTEAQMTLARSNIRAALIEYTEGDTGFIIHNAYITDETAIEESSGSETG